MRSGRCTNIRAQCLRDSIERFCPASAVWIRRGDTTLGALLWRRAGRGPFPAILVNHGSGRTREDLARLGPYENQAQMIGPVFATHGYVLLFLFRRGVGPSTSAGENAIDLMNEEFAVHGQTGRNEVQLLEGREMEDALAGLAWLRPAARRRSCAYRARRPFVRRIADGADGGRSTRSARCCCVLGRRIQLGPIAGAARPSH